MEKYLYCPKCSAPLGERCQIFEGQTDSQCVRLKDHPGNCSVTYGYVCPKCPKIRLEIYRPRYDNRPFIGAPNGRWLICRNTDGEGQFVLCELTDVFEQNTIKEIAKIISAELRLDNAGVVN